MHQDFRVGTGLLLAWTAMFSWGCEREDSQAAGQENAVQQEAVRGTMKGHNPRITSIEDVDAVGSGCPDPSSAKIEILPDGQGLLVQLNDLRASLGQGEAMKRSQCTLGVVVRVSPGYTFSLAQLEASGHVALRANGMESTFSSSYFFLGDRVNTARANDTKWNNPVDTHFRVEPHFAPDSRVWSRCEANRKLYIDLAVQVNNNRSESGTGSVEVHEVSRLALAWRPCS